LENVRYISISRDPIEIAISHYLHALHHDEKMFSDPSMSVPEYMRKNNIQLEQFVRDDLAVQLYGDKSLTVQNPIFNALTRAGRDFDGRPSEDALKRLVNKIDYF